MGDQGSVSALCATPMKLESPWQRIEHAVQELKAYVRGLPDNSKDQLDYALESLTADEIQEVEKGLWEQLVKAHRSDNHVSCPRFNRHIFWTLVLGCLKETARSCSGFIRHPLLKAPLERLLWNKRLVELQVVTVLLRDACSIRSSGDAFEREVKNLALDYRVNLLQKDKVFGKPCKVLLGEATYGSESLKNRLAVFKEGLLGGLSAWFNSELMGKEEFFELLKQADSCMSDGAELDRMSGASEEVLSNVEDFYLEGLQPCFKRIQDADFFSKEVDKRFGIFWGQFILRPQILRIFRDLLREMKYRELEINCSTSKLQQLKDCFKVLARLQPPVSCEVFLEQLSLLEAQSSLFKDLMGQDPFKTIFGGVEVYGQKRTAERFALLVAQIVKEDSGQANTLFRSIPTVSNYWLRLYHAEVLYPILNPLLVQNRSELEKLRNEDQAKFMSDIEVRGRAEAIVGDFLQGVTALLSSDDNGPAATFRSYYRTIFNAVRADDRFDIQHAFKVARVWPVFHLLCPWLGDQYTECFLGPILSQFLQKMVGSDESKKAFTPRSKDLGSQYEKAVNQILLEAESQGDDS